MPESFTQLLNMSRTGMLSRLTNLDVVANNIANINTTGFKSGRGEFQELLDNTLISGTQISATQNLMTQGNVYATGNSLDLAINGEGFFAVKLPDERTGYTRDGEFYLDANNQLVTASGFPLQMDGEIPADTEELHINPDGTVMSLKDDEWTQVATIQIYKFANPGALLSYGQNQWLETEISGEAQAGTPGDENYGKILSNALEKSNVSLAQEFVSMISMQRSFSMSLQSFQQTNTMLSLAIQMRKG